MENIRFATSADAEDIRNLFEQLGYPQTLEFIQQKLELLFDSKSDEVIVYDINGLVVGCILLHFSTQIVFQKDFMAITYFVVDENHRSLSIGKKLEAFACERAKDRNCELIEVFSMEQRTDAHRFYIREGYEEVRKMFNKKI